MLMFVSVISSKVTYTNNPFPQFTGRVDQGNRRGSYESRDRERKCQRKCRNNWKS